MAERLLSVGLDVGTSTTQLIVSEIVVENRASGFCVPEMDITGRKILYESPVRFTPLVGENLVDGDAIARFVEEEYKNAGILPGQVDTGAVIVTGETSRKENAAAVLQSLAHLAGDFVVATAGPDLESVLAAKGAGAVEYSEKTGKTVLHMDIGGGTSNLALIRDGKIVATGCLNVGGRLVKVEAGKIAYVSPVVMGIADEQCSPLQGRMEVGEVADEEKLEALARVLVQGLEMAAGLREVTPLLEALWTKECADEQCSPLQAGSLREGQDPPLQGRMGEGLGRIRRSAPTDSDGRFTDPSSITAYAVPPSPQGEGFSLPQSLRDSPAGPAPLLSAARTFSPLTGKSALVRGGRGRMEVGEIATPLRPQARFERNRCEAAALGARCQALVRNDVEFRRGAGNTVISFSGGVAECIGKDFEPFAFGDMGPVLGRAIRNSRLCQGEFMLGSQTIRATVIGAGCHSAQLSGSTVFCQNVALPLKNLAVAVVTEEEQLDPRVIAGRLAATDSPRAVLAIPGFPDAGYEQVARLADAIIKGFGEREILVCLERDMAKALGQRISLQSGRPCLCIDRVRLSQGSFLDVGKSVGPCLPVVVKTLIFNG